MRAARRLDIDLGAAERAGLGRGRGRGLFAAAEAFELMDALDDQEHEERHNQEINDRRDKSTVLNGGAVDTKYVIIEVGAPEEPDNGREDVLSQRGDKAGKGAADQDADREVQHVAAKGESFEFLQKFFHETFLHLDRHCVFYYTVGGCGMQSLPACPRYDRKTGAAAGRSSQTGSDKGDAPEVLGMPADEKIDIRVDYTGRQNIAAGVQMVVQIKAAAEGLIVYRGIAIQIDDIGIIKTFRQAAEQGRVSLSEPVLGILRPRHGDKEKSGLGLDLL